ncbi:2-hydroxyacyl-CoA dehydratase [Emcibacter sp.]|uniref:2-hydroxyacyl-CoA dehydratase n=1 Tax=Emcibacter sp. TaxID=1979954 RepID=UPI003A8D797C
MTSKFIKDILSDPLEAVRRTRHPIGYLGLDIPLDILLAYQGGVVHLPWTPDMVTPFADNWLESGFAPWTRSILEAWHRGEFDFLERVIFSRGSDNIQRLYYYICELQSRGVLAGPTAEIFDVAKIQRPTSLARNAEAVEKLCAVLKIDREALAGGIKKANVIRRKLADKLEHRSGAGASWEQLSRALLFADPQDVLEHFEVDEKIGGRRLILAGSVPPDDRIHQIIDRSGWTVIDEFHDGSLHHYGPAVTVAEEGEITALAKHIHQSSHGPRSFSNLSDRLLRRVDEQKPEAVILWMIEEDETLVWELPKQVAALEKAGIPYLALTRRNWLFNDSAGDEIRRFLEGVKK